MSRIEKVVGAYFAEWAIYKTWANGPYDISYVPWTNLTHFIYAFFPVCAPYEFFPQHGICTENDCTNQHIQDGNGIWSPFHNVYAACGYECSDWDISIHDPWASLTGSCGSGSWGGYAFLGKIADYKQRNVIKNTKIIPSIGGWTLSKLFFHLNVDEHRAKFVSSIRSFLMAFDNVFDGVDIDWEYPGGGGNDSGTTVEVATMTFNENNVPTLTGRDEIVTVEKEGNEATDRATYNAVMKDLRAMLSDLGGCSTVTACDITTVGDHSKCGCSSKYYELSAGISAGVNHIDKVSYGDAIKYMDNLFLMSYDFAGAFDLENLDHQTNPHDHNRSVSPTMESAEQAVRALIAQNVPAKKIVVGAAFFGRGWKDVTKKIPSAPEFQTNFINDDGKLDSGVDYFDGSYHGASAWFDEAQETEGLDRLDAQMPGIIDYSDIRRMLSGGECVEFYDQCAQAPLAYCKKSYSSEVSVVTYDNPRSIMAKGRLVDDFNLGGLFTWVLDADNGTLLNALNEAAGNKRADGSRGDYEKFNDMVYERTCDKAAPLPATTAPPTTESCVSKIRFFAWDSYCGSLTDEECEASSTYCEFRKDFNSCGEGCTCNCPKANH